MAELTMPITCVGLSHRTAPLALRERLALGRDDALATLCHADHSALSSAGIAELSVVSTCNRTEVYAAAPGPGVRFSDVPGSLTQVLLHSRGLEPDDVAPHLYRYASTDALRHLCRVAAGLDSMILGEAEVLGQVATAQAWATEAGTSGPILEAAFRTAIRAGRRARAETGICRSPMSIATEAVQLARDLAPTDSAVLLVGTGSLAQLLGRVLRSKGFTNLAVIGRTAERAQGVATAIGGAARPWHELREALSDADLVLTATAAPHAVITGKMVQSVMTDRPTGRGLAFVDLAVPRDVEPMVAGLPAVNVYNLEALQQRLQDNLAERRREVPRVEAIVDEEMALFEAWRHGTELKPILAAMRSRCEDIRRQETERALRRLGDGNPAVRREMEALSRTLVAKLLHEPSARLRIERDPTRSRLYAGAVRELFGLESLPSLADDEAEPA